ncbi:MAG: prepilin-type N-terminal cleavage/methylation domain-containing protein [Acidobacteria bacterium]|nr:prepilin-type N-terminal cleavage/methylation domain-containing protein [Acidobacteriota bacterium]
MESPKGFSILELLIVISIGLVLMGFSIPMIQSAMRNYTLNSAATNITRMMQLARYTAIRQGSNACTVLVGNIFGADADCDGALDPNAMAIVLPSGVSLTGAGPATTGMNFSTDPVAVADPFMITFTSRGSTTDSPAIDLIYLTGWGNSTAVTVSGAGRARAWQYIGGTWR